MNDRERMLLATITVLVLVVTAVVLALTVAVLLQGLAIHRINKTDHAQNTSIRALRR